MANELTTWRNRSMVGLNTLQRTMNRLFEDFFSPEFDIEAAQDKFTLSLDVPGVHKDDLKVEVTDNRLIITGERKTEGGRGTHAERRFGRFSRVIHLPDTIDSQKVEARHENGVLKISVPKMKGTRTKQIPIEEGHLESAH